MNLPTVGLMYELLAARLAFFGTFCTCNGNPLVIE